jgi:hypothetical protein
MNRWVNRIKTFKITILKIGKNWRISKIKNYKPNEQEF